MVKCDCCKKEVSKVTERKGKKFCCQECIKAADKKTSKTEVCEFC